MEGLGQFLHTTELVRKGLNKNLKQLGILLTMFDSRNNLSRQVMTEVKKHFAGTVFETVIPRNVKLSESPSHGKPVILYDISSSGSQSYLAVGAGSHSAARKSATENQDDAMPAGIPNLTCFVRRFGECGTWHQLNPIRIRKKTFWAEAWPL